MKLIAAAIFVLLCNTANCQHKITIHSLDYIGVLAGDATHAVQLHSVNGFQYKTWFAGAGVGVDWYWQRTVPIYFSLNRFFNNKPNTFFVTGDIGTNFMWDKSTGSRYNGYSSGGDFTPSLYFAAYAGYRFAVVKKGGNMLFNVGYTEKRMHETITSFPMCPECGPYINRYKYNLKRLSFRVGWMF